VILLSLGQFGQFFDGELKVQSELASEGADCYPLHSRTAQARRLDVTGRTSKFEPIVYYHGFRGKTSTAVPTEEGLGLSDLLCLFLAHILCRASATLGTPL